MFLTQPFIQKLFPCLFAGHYLLSLGLKFFPHHLL
ncbi:hypothetical protein MTY_0092 [Moorella thermoacetica Y72]|uniref:Uncharacterized protein n=1 Tax=Moorella thermoacetica Y72 TaxID=1325331 RepID=A0A0S6UB00_NEOTH|nr:hypothetical protein MTY_0092 [Moorella thermoacetica Y72]